MFEIVRSRSRNTAGINHFPFHKGVVSYSITSVRLDLIPVSWQSAAGDINHKLGGRLPLLSTRPAVNFPAKEITPWLVPNYTAW